MASRFCILSTVGPDPQTLAIPDWRGNNRLDTLRNIVVDGRVSALFMVAGSTTVVRVNGTAKLTADPEMTSRFQIKGSHPRSVIVLRIAEVYTQCARALMRSELWTSGDCPGGLPSAGTILAEMTRGDIDGAAYDGDWPARAEKYMW